MPILKRARDASDLHWRSFPIFRQSPQAMMVYYNGRFLEKSVVAISPDDRGFLFADGVYDVIRSYRGRLFKCAEHLERMAYGLRELRIEGLDASSLEQVAQQLIEDNKLHTADATVYLQVTR